MLSAIFPFVEQLPKQLEVAPLFLKLITQILAFPTRETSMQFINDTAPVCAFWTYEPIPKASIRAGGLYQVNKVIGHLSDLLSVFCSRKVEGYIPFVFGNEVFYKIIAPIIKELAKAGKKIFISTHDANIAVRTLPYNSVYRSHGPEGYKTFIGNPFSNSLVNTEDESLKIDWKKISMKTLEGGVEAFGERSKIYGNENA